MISIQSGSSVEWSSEENYKFRLSVFTDALKARYSEHENRTSHMYPSIYQAEVLDALNQPGGLEDLSISRPRERLTWGIPVPRDDSHTIYVWIDALTNYLTGAGYPWTNLGDEFTGSWPPDIQVIGKDILR